MWQDEMIPLVRVLIGDVSSPYTYSDDRITDLIITAAYIVNLEVAQLNDYTISIANQTISPDPVEEEVSNTRSWQELIVLGVETTTTGSFANKGGCTVVTAPALPTPNAPGSNLTSSPGAIIDSYDNITITDVASLL